MWRFDLFDTMSGLIDKPIDIPNFSWAVDINTCTLNTTRERRFSNDEATGLHLPWTSVPGENGHEKSDALASLRKSLLMSWTDEDSGDNYPILGGAIGMREDSELDVTFDLVSVYDMLDYRFLVREGTFGANVSTTTTDSGREIITRATSSEYHYENYSQRAIACEVIRECTSRKPGGGLPIDLPYLGEQFTHYNADGSVNQYYWRTYEGFNVANNSCKNILLKLSSTSYGPDMQFRPYIYNGNYVRYSFVAGSDEEIYLYQPGLMRTLTHYAGGGTLQGLTVAHDAPAERVYHTGSGEGAAMNCALAENLRLVNVSNPWPLVEMVRQDGGISGRTLPSRAEAILKLKSWPIIQVSGWMDANDPMAPRLGSFWPGELMELDIRDFPTLPDGTYQMRLMKMSGDETSKVKLLFDIYEDPYG